MLELYTEPPSISSRFRPELRVAPPLDPTIPSSVVSKSVLPEPRHRRPLPNPKPEVKHCATARARSRSRVKDEGRGEDCTKVEGGGGRAVLEVGGGPPASVGSSVALLDRTLERGIGEGER